MIQDRWSEVDLGGRIIAEMERGGERWEPRPNPAICSAANQVSGCGTMLMAMASAYARRRQPSSRATGRRSTSSGRRPTPSSEPPRQTLNIYGGSDYAVTSDGGDYTVHVVIGVDPENRMYLLDLWRGQTSSDVWIEAWGGLVEKWRPVFWAQEQGQVISG